MSRFKKILLSILVVFIGIQFIQSFQNKSVGVSPTDISKVIGIPENVQIILKNACYDCHCNNTNYPWYSKIQPIGWLMNKHIKQGKAELNFNEFGSYSSRRQLSKLTGIANSIRDNLMPLTSYQLMHRNAQLTKAEKLLIINWVQHIEDSLKVK